MPVRVSLRGLCVLLAALGLLLAGGPTRAHAADTGSATLTGTVSDMEGHPLSNAEIAVTDLGRETFTEADGRFTLPDLPLGDYTVVIRHAGYTPVVRDVLLHQDVTLDVRLAVNPFAIEPVNVTATRTPIDPLRAPLPTAALEGGDLRREHGVSLAHVLERVPGVRTLSTGAEIGKPMIRGLAGPRVLVLDNGHRMEDYSFSEEDGPSLDPETAERVEVVRGPASVLYGSDALGGVVNVIPAEVPEAEGRAGFVHGGASLYGATNNRELGSALRLEGATGDWGWRVHGVGRTAEALHTPDCELENTGFGAVNGEATLGRHGTRGNATFRYARYGGEFHLLEAHDAEAACRPEGTPEPAGEQGPVRKADDERFQLTTNVLPSGTLRIETKAQWQRHSLIEVSDEAGVDSMVGGGEPTAFDLLLNTLTADILGHHTAGENVRGTVGVSGLHQTNDSRGPIPLVPDATADGVAAFVFEQASAGRVRVLAGGRVDHRTLTGKTTAAETGTLLASGEVDRSWTIASGSAGLFVPLTRRASLAGNVGRAWRVPTLFELFANGPHLAENRYEIGDSSLVAETGLSLDGILRAGTDRARLEVSGFRHAIDDFLFAEPTGEERVSGSDTLQVFRHVQADALLRGLEAVGEIEPLPLLQLGVRYEMVRGTYRNGGGNLPLMPPPRLRVEAEVHTPRGSGRGQAFLEGEVERVFEQTHLSLLDDSEGAEAYTLLHLHAGIDRQVAGRPWRLDVRARNVANTRYVDFLSRYKAFALAPGRDIVVRLSTDF